MVIVLVILVTYPWQVEKKGKKKRGREVKSQGGNMASRPLSVLCWSEQIKFIYHCLSNILPQQYSKKRAVKLREHV